MDPIEYALSYDRSFRKALSQRSALSKLKMAVLAHCLKLDAVTLSTQ